MTATLSPSQEAILRTRHFTLDGEDCDIIEFLEVNADDDLDGYDASDIARLEVGEVLIFGGGAAAEFELHRTA